MKTHQRKPKNSSSATRKPTTKTNTSKRFRTLGSERLTHDQRRARRKQIAKAVLVAGRSATDVASEFGMNIAQVYSAVHEFRGSIKHKTRDQRLREKMLPLVEKIRKGAKLAALALEYAVDVQKLSALCREHGVALRRGRPKETVWNPKRYAGADWSTTDRQIAAKLGCTHQAVNAIRHKLIRLGLLDSKTGAVLIPGKNSSTHRPANRRDKKSGSSPRKRLQSA